MDSPKTPSEALNRAIARATWMGGTRKKLKPGEIIASMSEEERALLRDLKSDDISPKVISSDVAWLGIDSDRQKWATLMTTEKLKFDRETLRKN